MVARVEHVSITVARANDHSPLLGMVPTMTPARAMGLMAVVMVAATVATVCDMMAVMAVALLVAAMGEESGR